MTEWKFIAYSQPWGIAGTSYQLQMGRVNDAWAIRLIKDDTVLKQQIFNNPNPRGMQKAIGEDSYFPESNSLIGWVKISIMLPNVNEYSIARTINVMTEEAKKNYERKRLDRKTAGKEERDSVKLKHVEESNIHRPISPGEVVNIYETNDPKILHQYIRKLETNIEQMQKQIIRQKNEIKNLRNERITE